MVTPNQKSGQYGGDDLPRPRRSVFSERSRHNDLHVPYFFHRQR